MKKPEIKKEKTHRNFRLTLKKPQGRTSLPLWAGEQFRQTDFALFFNVAVRLALLCIATAGVGLLIVQLYRMPVDNFRVALWCFGSALFFNVLFLYLKFRYAFPLFGIFGLLYIRLSDILFDLGCFIDFFLIYFDGNLFGTARFSSRSAGMVLDGQSLLFLEGLQRSVIFICVLLAFFFAISARGKFIGSILITSILLLIPAITVARASYVPAFTFLAVSMIGLYSIWASQEQSFLKAVKPRKQKRGPFIPRIHRHGVNGAASAIIALVACILAQAIIPAHKTQDTINFFSDLSDKIIDLAYEIGDRFSGFEGIIAPSVEHGGGLTGGNINASSSISINNPTISRRQVMNVILEDAANPVYLRNGIGAVFNPDKGTWSVSSGGNHMRDFPDNFYPEHEYLVFMQKVNSLNVNSEHYISRQKIEIEYLARTSHVVLPVSPYFPEYKTDSRFRWNNDAFLSRRGGNAPQTFVWDVLYPRHGADFASVLNGIQQSISSVTPLAEGEAGVPGNHEDYVRLGFDDGNSGALRIYSLDYNLTSAEYLDYLAAYEEMIYDAYTVTAPSESANIRALNDEVNKTLIFGRNERDLERFGIIPDYVRVQRVEQFLKTNYSYSLVTDNNAGDNTMLGNFLFETKSGHCALYATAMTLAVREMGLPARYVTGYIAGGSIRQIERTNDGRFMQTVLARDFHAWVEVYFKGIGWLPFDPTPPIYEWAFTEAERERGNDTVATTPRTTPPTMPQTSPSPSPPPTPPVTTPPVATTPLPTSPEIPDDIIITTPELEPLILKSLVPYHVLRISVIIILSIIPLLASLLFVKSVGINERRRLKKYSGLSDTQTAREAYRFILKLLQLEGFSAAPGETPVKFAERVDEAVQRQGLSPVINEIEKLEFSREELTSAEYEKLSEAVVVLYERTVGENKPFKRFLRKIVLFDVIK